MRQVRVLSKGGRITGGVFCLLFALHTWLWVVRDVAELGLGTAWDVWTGVAVPSAKALPDIPATASEDLGLGLLQIAAAVAAFTGAWAAGGLMASATLLTFAYRLPSFWHMGLHTDDYRFYLMEGPDSFTSDSTVGAALGTVGLVLLLTLPLALVLLVCLRPWTGQAVRPRQPAPQPYFPPQPGGSQPPYGQIPGAAPQAYDPNEPPLPGECPQRPVTAHALVTVLFLGTGILFSFGWSVHLLIEGGVGPWLNSFTGRFSTFSLLDVTPAWGWLAFILAAAIGAGLAMGRTVSARGFTLGIALVELPPMLLALAGGLTTGHLLDLSGPAPVMSLLATLQILLSVGGGAALIVMSFRPGVPAHPGAAAAARVQLPFGPGGPVGAPAPAAPYGVPQGAPQQGYGPVAPQGQPQGPPQQQGGPQPYMPPPPAGPPPGAPPQPPAPPATPPQGGAPGGQFGPPPST